jgi:hypothetical protein
MLIVSLISNQTMFLFARCVRARCTRLGPARTVMMMMALEDGW